MKKRKIFITITVILIAILAISIAILKKDNGKTNEEIQDNEWKNDFSDIDKNTENYQEQVDIEALKNDMGLTADDNMYEITEEYDGRKTLNIKPTILYKTAFAGIIKQSKPNLNEIDEIFESKYPKNTGIWISEKSRNLFLEFLNKNTNCTYEINNEGYLKIKESQGQSNTDKEIEKAIKSNKKYIIDISKFDYDVDVVTGEIVEYPFEQLGDMLDVVNSDNDEIIVMSDNSNKEFDDKEILEELISNL